MFYTCSKKAVVYAYLSAVILSYQEQCQQFSQQIWWYTPCTNWTVRLLCMFYFKRLKPFQAPFFTTASHFPLERMIHSVKPPLNEEISTASFPESFLLINLIIPLVLG